MKQKCSEMKGGKQGKGHELGIYRDIRFQLETNWVVGSQILTLSSLYIDSSRVWVHSKSSLAQEGWDFRISGSSPIPFDSSTGRPHLNFIGDNKWWVSGPYWIKDIATGKEVFQLSGRHAKPSDVQWDGQYLVAGYESEEVLILDFHYVPSRDM